jgi:phospholipid transport system substrate-binding protein
MFHPGKLVFTSVFLFFLLANGLCPGVHAAQNPDPSEQLRPYIDKIVSILTDPELQGEEACLKRREKVMAMAQERFDFDEMSRRVLGPQWRSLSADEQNHFVGLFTTLLEHAYIGKIEDYSDQKVEIRNQRVRNDRAQVETDIIDKNIVIPVSYIMLLKNGEWLVYDIVVEGVSLVRNYMEQFKEIIRKNGYPSLLKQMEKKIGELEKSIGKPCPTDFSMEESRS